MPTEVYQEYMKSQQKMFEEWQEQMKSFSATNPEAIIEDPTAYYQKVFESSKDFWNKIGDGSEVYQKMFELWKRISESSPVLDRAEVIKIYEDWSKRNFESIRKHFIPTLPVFAKESAESFTESMEGSFASMADYSRTWASNEETLQKALKDAATKGSKGLSEGLEALRTFYENSAGKLINAPSFGRDMEFWERQKAILDRFIKFNIASSEFYGNINEILQDTTKKVLEDYAKMSKEGTQPKTFDEFYAYWNKAVNAAYNKVLFSEELSAMSGKMVDELSKYKASFDKVWESYLAFYPIPKKSDLDALYKTVYDLKKEVKALKKEVATLKNVQPAVVKEDKIVKKEGLSNE